MEQRHKRRDRTPDWKTETVFFYTIDSYPNLDDRTLNHNTFQDCIKTVVIRKKNKLWT